jgi:hypothetical protein
MGVCVCVCVLELMGCSLAVRESVRFCSSLKGPLSCPVPTQFPAGKGSLRVGVMLG